MRRIMFVLVFMIGICLSGEAKESGIKLISVYEKTFEDTIVDVIFDTLTVTLEEAKAMGWKEEAFSEEEKAKGEVVVAYPKVMLVGKKGFSFRQRIRFLDRSGKVKKEVSGKGASRIIFSTNGKYILKALRYDMEYDSGGGAILYDNNGNVLWKKSQGAFYAVTDNGYTATGFVSPTGASYPFIIYSPLGDKVREIKLPDWSIYDAGICANGEYFIITYVGKAGFDSTGVMIITREGKEIQNMFVKGNVYPWKVLPMKEGILVIYSGKRESKFILLDQYGNMKWESKIPIYIGGFPLLEYLNGKQFIFFREYGHLLKINTYSGKVEFHEDLNSFLKVRRFGLKIFRNNIYMNEQHKIEGFNLKEVER